MKNKLLILILLFVGVTSFSQNVQTSNANDATVCNGYAYFTDSLLYTSFEWYDSDYNLISNPYNASLYDLCPDDYYIIGTNINSNIDTISFNIGSNNCSSLVATITSITPYSINGDCAGELMVNVVGGTPNYTYYWSGIGAGTNTLSNLCSGTYTVNVQDDNSCLSQVSYVIVDSTINVPPSISISDSINCNSIATLNNPLDYTYWEWQASNGYIFNSTNSNISLCPNDYTLLTVSTSGDTIYTDFTINGLCVNNYTVSSTLISAYGVCDGEIIINTPIGSSTYSHEITYHSFDNYNYIITNSTLDTLTNLCSGYYSILSTDSIGCQYSTFTNYLNVDSSMFSVVAYPNNESFSGACDGTVYVYPNFSGVAPYTYTYSSLNDTTYSIDSLCSGTYTVTITDSNGLSGTESFTIGTNTLPAPTISTNDNTDILNCNGSATINDTAGLDNWLWIDNNGNTIQTNGTTINGLCAGSYELYTQNDTLQFNIYDSIPCLNFIVTTSTAYDYNSACIGISSSSTSGGIAPYTFTYTNGLVQASNYQYGPNVSQVLNLCVGTYTVTATDVNGCVATNTFYIGDSTNFTSMNINATITNTTSNNACDGYLTMEVNGGTLPYVIDGTPTTSSYLVIDDLCPGVYTTIIYDASGDSLIYTYLIATSSTTIINNPYTGSNSIVIDTTTNDVITNCIINYQNIDSAGITGVNYAAIDSVIVDYTIYYNDGSSVVITEAYTDSFATGVYVFILDLFCPNKSTLNFLKLYDEINFDPNMIGTAWQLGVKDNSSEIDFSVYPVPFNNQLTIKLNESDDYQVTVYDISGKLVYTNTYNQTEVMTLDVTNLSKGQYILRIQNDKSVISKKIIK